ncbi:hypothetical protein FUT88_13200 [Ralstonia sp. TCR112]|nr:hypothetical protein FUT88_13200 [Ralstonia sp. TCR112]
MTNEAAAIKLAERDNLVGELVEALESFVKAVEWADANKDSPYSALKHFSYCAHAAREAIAKAREGAQS